MADGNNTPILVAAIGAAATLGVGVFANWDKFSGGKAKAEAPPATEAAVEAAALVPAPEISGAWTEPDYGAFRFTQAGGAVTFENDYNDETYLGTGEVEGRFLYFRYNVVEGEAQWICNAEVAAGDMLMTGSCKDSSNGKNFDIKLTREPAASAV